MLFCYIFIPVTQGVIFSLLLFSVDIKTEEPREWTSPLRSCCSNHQLLPSVPTMLPVVHWALPLLTLLLGPGKVFSHFFLFLFYGQWSLK